MLSTYSFKRRAILVVTMIFATLAVAMMAQSASAQEITTIDSARMHLATGNSFQIDTGGLGGGEYSFRITRLNDDGTFVGKYFRNGIGPRDPNVTGKIRITVVGDLFRLQHYQTKSTEPIRDEKAVACSERKT